jgi:hypothetical protein
MSKPPCVCEGVPHGQTESGSVVLAVICWARASRGGVTRQVVVLADLQSLLDCQENLSLSLISLSPPPPLLLLLYAACVTSSKCIYYDDVTDDVRVDGASASSSHTMGLEE